MQERLWGLAGRQPWFTTERTLRNIHSQALSLEPSLYMVEFGFDLSAKPCPMAQFIVTRCFHWISTSAHGRASGCSGASLMGTRRRCKPRTSLSSRHFLVFKSFDLVSESRSLAYSLQRPHFCHPSRAAVCVTDPE